MTSAAVAWPRRTERLLLRPVRPDDVDRLLQFRNHPDVFRWLLKTEVEPERFRAAWLGTLDDPDDHSAVAEFEGRVIGTGSLDVLDGMGQDGAAPTRRSEGLIGYLLDPAYAGSGFATEIAAAMLSIAFDELGLRRVTAGCFADNRASRRVLEKVGMRLEQYGVQDSWHAELGWLDGCTYGLLGEEWAGRTGGPAPVRTVSASISSLPT